MLFLLALRHQHHLLVDERADTWGVWRGQLSEAVTGLVDLAAQIGRSAAARAPAGRRALRVVDARSEWKLGRVSLSDALRLLETPLRLVVENRRHDAAFLRCLLNDGGQRARAWIAALEDGRVVIEHMGGLGEMKMWLEELLTHDSVGMRALRLRSWVMFDRDADPGDRSRPSKASEAIRELCEHRTDDPWAIGHLQLGRRTIESYAPDVAIDRWTGQAHALERPRRARAAAALRCARERCPEAAWQLNMKAGLLGDQRSGGRKEARRRVGLSGGAAVRTRRLVEPDPLFRGLDVKDWDALSRGLGDDLAEWYCSQDVDPLALQKEYDRGPVTQRSRVEILDDILRRL